MQLGPALGQAAPDCWYRARQGVGYEPQAGFPFRPLDPGQVVAADRWRPVLVAVGHRLQEGIPGLECSRCMCAARPSSSSGSTISYATGGRYRGCGRPPPAADSGRMRSGHARPCSRADVWTGRIWRIPTQCDTGRHRQAARSGEIGTVANPGPTLPVSPTNFDAIALNLSRFDLFLIDVLVYDRLPGCTYLSGVLRSIGSPALRDSGGFLLPCRGPGQPSALNNDRIRQLTVLKV